MKKYIIRTIGALCIIASLVLTFFPAWVKIDGIKGRDIRTFRKELTTDLDFVRDTLITALEYDSYKDDLRDNDLPNTKAGIKKRTREAAALVDELVNEEITLKETVWLSVVAPKYITDTEKFLNTDRTAYAVLNRLTTVSYADIEETVDGAKEYEFIFYAVFALLASVVILGAVAAVTNVLDKGRFIKYIFMAVLLLLAASICVGVPILSEWIQNEFNLRKEVEDITLRTTICPYLAVVLTMVPVVLDSIFEHKKTKKLEA